MAADPARRHGHTLTLAGITQQFGAVMAANNVSLDVEGLTRQLGR